MHEALKVAGYVEHRPSLTAAELRPLVADHPALIEQWLSYSDKRDGDSDNVQTVCSRRDRSGMLNAR
jgi:hypothetical protein